MIKPKPKPKPKRRVARHHELSERDAVSAEALTVAWSICVLSALLSNCAALVVDAMLQWFSQTHGLIVFSRLLLASNVLLGVLTLVLTVTVLQVRRVRPPIELVWLAFVISVLPWLVALVKSLGAG